MTRTASATGLDEMAADENSTTDDKLCTLGIYITTHTGYGIHAIVSAAVSDERGHGASIRLADDCGQGSTTVPEQNLHSTRPV